MTKQLQIQSKRCEIRFLEISDYQTFVEGFNNCKESQNDFDDGKIDTAFMSETWYQKLLNRRTKEADEDYCYMFNIFELKTGRSIGYCDITPMYREDIQLAKVGYTIFNNYWGQGYGTEVLQALTKIAFTQLELHRLEAHINLDNPASVAVVTKCNYKFEGIREKFILEDGVWTDNMVYYTINE